MAVVSVGMLLGQPSRASGQAGWTGVVTDVTTALGSGPLVAFDSQGNAMAVWVWDDVRSARYTAATGRWSASTSVSAPTPSHFTHGRASFAMNDSGDAIAVWTVVEGGWWDDAVSHTFAARYSAATATWGPQVRVNDGREAQPAIDSAGNAFVVWTGYWSIEAARYDVATGWSIQSIAPGGGLFSPTDAPRIAMDPDGNAVLVWTSTIKPDEPIQAARFVAATRSWTAPVTLSVATRFQQWMWPQVAVDRLGNAMAIWVRNADSSSAPQVSRYDAATETWSAPRDLSVSQRLHYSPPPAIAGDAAGNFVAVWSEYDRNKIKSAAYTRASDSWSPTTDVADVSAVGSAEPHIITDAGGNSTVLWSFSQQDPRFAVSITRRTAAGAWSPVIGPVPSVISPRLAVDRVGNVMMVFNLGGASVKSTMWLATPAAPLISRATTANGVASVEFEAPSAEPGFETTNYEYSLDEGATWTPRSPASTSSPLIISGVELGQASSVRLRGVNLAGSGIASAPAPIIPAAPPSAPSGLLGLADGSTVVLAWQNTQTGGAPSGIELDVTGDAVGTFDLQLTDRLTLPGVPAGTYTVVVRAVNAAGRSGPSNAVTLTFPGTCSSPATPTNFSAARGGSTITVAWSPPLTGAAPTGYIVFVGGSFEGSFPTSSLSLSGDAPSGMYLLSVAATNPCGASAATPVQPVTVP